MYKKNGRVTFRSNRRQNYKRSSYSNGKSRNKGNVLQQYQKYLKLAKEASSSGDRVQSEYYYQFTDHYSRLMIESGISFGDSDSNNDVNDLKSVEQKEAENNSEVEETNSLKDETSSDADGDHGSIESVSFLSEPAKKNPKKLKKE
tara:strand:- start:1078 stop:1515 length:438 start_codon:yes stop_codon:yes gene_type:complete